MKLIWILCVVTLIVICKPSEASVYGNIAEACAWLKENFDYGCDGDTDRDNWRTYLDKRYDVTDCDSFCTNYHQKSDGSCQPGHQDDSTWCPFAQQCVCE